MANADWSVDMPHCIAHTFELLSRNKRPRVIHSMAVGR